ncbi:MAG TPA: right-handed parallel beta-helix repeat-containing protein [Rubrobacter sp.]
MRGLLRVLPVGLLAILLAAFGGVGSAGAQGAVGAIVGPGESIQKAVNAADPGDTILVSGVHREDVVIRKNGISLRGTNNAVIKPPARVDSPCGPSGICVLGDVNFNTGKVNKYVNNVSISGLTVKNFRDSGLFAIGARDATFTDNHLINDEEYGAFALFSTGTKIISNVARGSDEAGIYVGGSPNSNAKVVGNETYGNFLGIFIRDALKGTIAGNRVHNNCLGVMFLADAPGPSGNYEVRGNWVRDNTRSCPATAETPPLSGVGISLYGAQGVKVTGNHIAGNVPTGPTIFSGGVVVVRGFGGTAPKNNSVFTNDFGRNKPDIYWDGSGTGNRLTPNKCNTSVPARFCS